MTAKEMFEKLGYELKPSPFTRSPRWVHKNDDDQIIVFDTDYKTYDATQCYEGGLTVSPELHKAIHQYLIELGWL